MTHFKIYVIPEKLYTVAYFDEADKLYYICGCSTGYRPEQVIKMHEITFDSYDRPCIICQSFMEPDGRCTYCDTYSKFKSALSTT